LCKSARTDIYKPPHPLRSALYGTHERRRNFHRRHTKKPDSPAKGHYGQGVAVGDYDNDGYPDLYVTGYGRAILYHNNGDGTFTDVTVKAGVADEAHWAAGPPAPGGSITTKMAGSISSSHTSSGRRKIIFGAANIARLPFVLVIPATTKAKRPSSTTQSDGTFTDVSDTSGVGKPESKGMGVVLADFNNDGWPTSPLPTIPGRISFLNKHDGTFQDVSFVSGIAASEDGRYEGGHGHRRRRRRRDGFQEFTSRISISN